MHDQLSFFFVKQYTCDAKKKTKIIYDEKKQINYE